MKKILLLSVLVCLPHCMVAKPFDWVGVNAKTGLTVASVVSLVTAIGLSASDKKFCKNLKKLKRPKEFGAFLKKRGWKGNARVIAAAALLVSAVGLGVGGAIVDAPESDLGVGYTESTKCFRRKSGLRNEVGYRDSGTATYNEHIRNENDVVIKRLMDIAAEAINPSLLEASKIKTIFSSLVEGLLMEECEDKSASDIVSERIIKLKLDVSNLDYLTVLKEIISSCAKNIDRMEIESSVFLRLYNCLIGYEFNENNELLIDLIYKNIFKSKAAEFCRWIVTLIADAGLHYCMKLLGLECMQEGNHDSDADKEVIARLREFIGCISGASRFIEPKMSTLKDRLGLFCYLRKYLWYLNSNDLLRHESFKDKCNFKASNPLEKHWKRLILLTPFIHKGNECELKLESVMQRLAGYAKYKEMCVNFLGADYDKCCSEDLDVYNRSVRRYLLGDLRDWFDNFGLKRRDEAICRVKTYNYLAEQ